MSDSSGSVDVGAATKLKNLIFGKHMVEGGNVLSLELSSDWHKGTVVYAHIHIF